MSGSKMRHFKFSEFIGNPTRMFLNFYIHCLQHCVSCERVNITEWIPSLYVSCERVNITEWMYVGFVFYYEIGNSELIQFHYFYSTK